MTTVYIIYSRSTDKFYAGTCRNFEMQLIQHQKKHFKKPFTTEATDWRKYFLFEGLPEDTANRVLKHVKKNKSREYFDSLRNDPAVSESLIEELSSHRR